LSDSKFDVAVRVKVPGWPSRKFSVRTARQSRHFRGSLLHCRSHGRGLDENLARQVAVQLTQKDALGAHARDELGISEMVMAQPIQAAVVSAMTFAAGAVIPLIIALVAPVDQTSVFVAGTTLIGLAALGGLGASAGGAGVVKGALRVTFWGALAMAATAAVGMIFGVGA